MNTIRKSIINDISKEIPKMINCYFVEPKRPKEKKNTTSYMCWLKDNREQFEICSKCQISLELNKDKKKTCPKCEAKINATDVARLAGLAWKYIPQDVKENYKTKAKTLNQKKI